ncbi:MAG: CotH kinase family protein, partial [Prevotella sp.]|nr:CotH kinase family protein [Prevotella sp.]
MMKLTSKTILFGALAGAALLLSLQAQADNVTLTTSDLPIVIINTDAEINADAKIPGTMQIIDNGSGQTNSVSDTPNGFDGHIGIKLRGESSLNFNQKKYTIETWDAQGNDSTVSIFGMPEESDWVLLAPYNDVSMVRDVYAFALWNEMGHWGPRTRMCEVIVNNDYRGVYAFCERIKRDKNRVDISKLKPEDISGRDLTGGYIVRIDAYDEEDLTFQSKVPGIQKSAWAWGGNQQQEAPVTWTIYYPKKEDIVEPQRQYIQDYIDKVELTIQSADFADPEKGYAQYIDVSSFVDYFIHT